MKRVVLTGAESTGKSTLACKLAQHFNAPHSTEYLRAFVNETQRAPQATDLEAIAKGQIALEDACRPSNKEGLVIHDTNLLSNLIYAEHYFGGNLDWLLAQFNARRYDLYLLCLPDFPWVPDRGQREGPEVRDSLHQKFLLRLEAMHLPFTPIGGSPGERLQTAIHCIQTLDV